MRRSPGVFNTDQVNRDRIRFPASELMRAEQNYHRECLRRGVGLGMPVHMQHDMHRLIGWSRTLGLYADSEMVRALGLIEEPETEQEKAELQARAKAYWEQHHREGAEPYRDELITRVAPADLGNACFLRMEAAVVNRTRHRGRALSRLVHARLGLRRQGRLGRLSRSPTAHEAGATGRVP